MNLFIIMLVVFMILREFYIVYIEYYLRKAAIKTTIKWNSVDQLVADTRECKELNRGFYFCHLFARANYILNIPDIHWISAKSY